MHFESALDAADRAFLDDFRAFMDEHLDPALVTEEDLLRTQVADHYRSEAWEAAMRPHGWQAATWPKAYGGAELNAMQNYIVLYEGGLRGAPLLSPLGLNYVGPVVLHFGTEAQKAEVLPGITSGEDKWCQGFSEPGSGSDLGSVRTFAERRGDSYVINGSKIWTTDAHHANKMFVLVRTARENAKSDLSFMLLDMDMPGVSVEPIHLMTGDHEVNQVFFDDVELTPDRLVAGEGEGWAVAKYLLEIERGAFVYGGRLRRRFQHLVDRARGMEAGVPDAFWPAAAELDLELLAYEVTEFRLGHLTAREDQTRGEPNIIKIGFTEVMQHIDELALMIARPEELYRIEAGASRSQGGLPMSTWLAAYFNNRAATVYGGSNEIQRELIFRTIRKSVS